MESARNRPSIAGAVYPVVSGRVLYNELSITGLNRAPVDILSNYVLSGVKATGTPPMPPAELCKRLLVDGTMLWVNDVHQGNIEYAERVESTGLLRVLQSIPRVDLGSAVRDLIREYLQTADGWAVTDYLATSYDTVSRQPQGSTVYLSADSVKCHYNENGILYPVQQMYRRLEEIARTIRKQQTGPNSKTVIGGPVFNPYTAKAELESDSYVAFVPGEWKLDRATNGEAIAQLMNEFNLLLRLYNQRLCIIDAAYQPDRPSGADRYILAGPMFRQVETIRENMNQVCAMFSASLSFTRYHTSSQDDRIKGLQIIQTQRDMGALSVQEAADAAREI